MLKTLDSIDLKLINEVGDLYTSLDKDKVDMLNIESKIKSLSRFCKHQKYNYLNNLMYPEINKGVKIPTPIPIPSCSFQLHNCVTLRTNNLGNLAIIFNPFFLYSTNILDKVNNLPPSQYYPDVDGTGKIKWLSSFFINKSDSVTGHNYDPNWEAVDIG